MKRVIPAMASSNNEPAISSKISNDVTSGAPAGSDKCPACAGRAPVKVHLVAGQNYAFCTCGLSAIQPFCDGTHRGTGFRPFKFDAERDEDVWMCLCKRTQSVPCCDGSHETLPEDDTAES